MKSLSLGLASCSVNKLDSRLKNHICRSSTIRNFCSKSTNPSLATFAELKTLYAEIAGQWDLTVVTNYKVDDWIGC